LNYRQLIQAPFEVTQIAYVTRDIKSSAARFAARAGIESFPYIQSLCSATIPGPFESRWGCVFLGESKMIELIEPLSGNCGLYTKSLPPAGEDLRLHHLGMFTQDFWRWKAILKAIDDEGMRIALAVSHPGMECIYVDHRADLGHYVEYGLLEGDEGMKALKNWPHY
jgi:hypothetical protein